MPERLASAAIGLPLLAGAVWLGPPWLAAVVALVAAAAYWELHALVAQADARPSLVHGAAFAVALSLNGAWEGAYALPIVAAGLLSGLAWQIARGAGRATPLTWAIGIAGPVYIGVPLSFALLLRDLELGREWLLLVLLVTFATDSGAYFVGRLVGRHPMAPVVSPKKTWEGAAGGLAVAVGACVALGAVLPLLLAWWLAALVGGALGVAAQVGDLAESWLKRALNAKEAGRLIPGHGGVLDRADSVVFTLVVGYYLAQWVR